MPLHRQALNRSVPATNCLSASEKACRRIGWRDCGNRTSATRSCRLWRHRA